MSVKESFYSFILDLQNQICNALQTLDGKEKFREDKWVRPEGGGGITRVIAHGNVFEKGGVNTSAVHGELPQAMRDAFKVDGKNFYACGLSMVLHPVNPYVPTVHANWRYFELSDENGKTTDTWFGGGADLTPYYIFEEDGIHFHSTLKAAMDPFGKELYPQYKEQCDSYFINRHRNNEARGIGGVFYDYLRPQNPEQAEQLLKFQYASGNEQELSWQEIRRGRYAEFNLIHDRGTLFGLKTNGRIESILMSMPPRARWEYDYHPAAGTKEAELLEYLKPRNWVK